MLSRAARLLIAFTVLAGMAVTGTANTRAADRSIEIDEGFVKTLKLGQAARTIAIGNPKLLDATIADGQTIVLTAKARGITNVVILGNEGTPVSQLTVHIEPASDTNHRVLVRSGHTGYVYFCNPGCELIDILNAEERGPRPGATARPENTQPNGRGGQP